MNSKVFVNVNHYKRTDCGILTTTEWSERKNRSVMEMTHAMLKGQKMQNKFWAETVDTAIYLQNRLPSAALEKITHIEEWTRHKPSLSHIKVFGYLCYVQKPVERRTKLEDKS